MEAVASNRKVLVIGSNATRIEVQSRGTAAIRQYSNENVVPAMALLTAGFDVVLATPNGTKPHIDEASRSADQQLSGKEVFQWSPQHTNLRHRPVRNRASPSRRRSSICGSCSPMRRSLEKKRSRMPFTNSNRRL